jgi:hypothetical protein
MMRFEKIINRTTGNYTSEITKLRKAWQDEVTIIVGAGSGLSASAGYDFADNRL